MIGVLKKIRGSELPVMIQKLKKYGFFCALYEFFKWILPGMRLYRRIQRSCGRSVTIIVHPWPGTGDIFLLHEYFSLYLAREKITDYVVTTSGGAAKKIVDLFPLQNSIQISSNETLQLVRLYEFMGSSIPNLKILHHCPLGLHTGINSMLQGIHGTTTRDMLLGIAAGISVLSGKTDKPCFSEDLDAAHEYLKKNGLQPGKTIILAPFSKSCSSMFPIHGWEYLARFFSAQGYSVCTNCGDMGEQPIKGTHALYFPFVDGMSILEAAGYFISNRSGLCDVIGFANCKKVVLYQYNVYCGPNPIINYWGLENIGLGKDVLEIEYHPFDVLDTIFQIVDYVGGKFLIDKLKIKMICNELACVELPKPSFSQNCVTAVFCTNSFYVPRLQVALQSLVDFSSTEHQYEIILLVLNLSVGMVETLTAVIKDHPNIELKIYKIEHILNSYLSDFKEEYVITKYVPLMLPRFLKAYERVLYFDSDIVINADIYDLWNYKLGNDLVAATPDIGIMCAMYDPHFQDVRIHVLDELHLNEGKDFFNTGVMILNLSMLRKTYSSATIFQIYTSGRWVQLGRDMLVKLCQGRVYYLPQEWNVMVQKPNDLLPFKNTVIGKSYIKAAAAPNIIHYTGNSSLKCDPMPDLHHFFWNAAKRTPYYEFLLYQALPIRTIARSKKNEIQLFLNPVKQRRLRSFIDILLPKGTRRRERVKNFYHKYRGL